MTVAEVRGLTVSLVRDGVRSTVLDGIDLAIAPGEILGLVGQSGSGKSMLALALLGLLPATAHPQVDGVVHVAGTDMVRGSDRERRAARRTALGAIFQDPMTSLNPTMRVGRQITETGQDRVGAIRLLGAMGVPEPELKYSVYPHQLSGGLRQRVMAAIALGGRPELVVADEPTTALDVTVQAQVLDLLRELRDVHGCSVLFITHDLGVAAQLADRVAVMYSGKLVECGPTVAVLRDPAHPYTAGLLRSRLSLDLDRRRRLATLVADGGAVDSTVGCAYRARCALAVERCASEVPPADASVVTESHHAACWRPAAAVRSWAVEVPEALLRDGVAAADGSDAAVAVSVNDLVCTFTVGHGRSRRKVEAVRGVSFEVATGDTLAIVGESGSGKSTVLRAVAGLAPVTSGSLHLAAGGAQMVFQDAGSSLTPWLTIGELLRERLAPERLGRIEAEHRVVEALDRIGLPASVARAKPRDLSGGQRQRVALARATIMRPAVLLCDEPTSALDASLAATTLNLIRDLQQELAMTVLFVTHDLAVARLMGHRVAVMNAGKIVEVGDADDVISRPRDPYTQRLVAAVPRIEAVG